MDVPAVITGVTFAGAVIGISALPRCSWLGGVLIVAAVLFGYGATMYDIRNEVKQR